MEDDATRRRCLDGGGGGGARVEEEEATEAHGALRRAEEAHRMMQSWDKRLRASRSRREVACDGRRWGRGGGAAPPVGKAEEKGSKSRCKEGRGSTALACRTRTPRHHCSARSGKGSDPWSRDGRGVTALARRTRVPHRNRFTGNRCCRCHISIRKGIGRG